MECFIKQPFLNEFLLFVKDNEDNGNLSDSDSDVPDELKQDYIDEVTGEGRSNRSFELFNFIAYIAQFFNRMGVLGIGGGLYNFVLFFSKLREIDQ